MIRIRAFRAVDELESCQKFVEGHMRILKVFGITMITSANIEWFVDPNTYVIVAESLVDNKVLGGARVQVYAGDKPLPIQSAVCELDNSIHHVVEEYSKYGVAELCGLWNSREIAGYGIGSIFLTRTAVSIAPQLNIKALFALCAPYTVKMAKNSGFEIATFIGNEGTFYYPKEDLLATAMLLSDIQSLSTAVEDEKKEILSLRNNLFQQQEVTGRNGKFILQFDLDLNR